MKKDLYVDNQLVKVATGETFDVTAGQQLVLSASEDMNGISRVGNDLVISYAGQDNITIRNLFITPSVSLTFQAESFSSRQIRPILSVSFEEDSVTGVFNTKYTASETNYLTPVIVDVSNQRILESLTNTILIRAGDETKEVTINNYFTQLQRTTEESAAVVEDEKDSEVSKSTSRSVEASEEAEGEENESDADGDGDSSEESAGESSAAFLGDDTSQSLSQKAARANEENDKQGEDASDSSSNSNYSDNSYTTILIIINSNPSNGDETDDTGPVVLVGFQLTLSLDNLIGTTGNDIFRTLWSEYAQTDFVDGLGGYDQLVLDDGGVFTLYNNLTSIEELFLSDFNYTINMMGVTGIQVIDASSITAAFGLVLNGATYTENLTIIGGDGVDNITAGSGDDVIEGGLGADVLDGGTGNDTLDYTNSNAGVTVNLGTNAVAGGHATGDTVSNFENVRGSGFVDNLTGDNNANSLNAGGGNDVLTGAGGNDELNGEGGDDTISGGLGDDTIDGGAGTDTVTYAGAAGGVTVDLAAMTATGEGNDALIGVENVTGSGNNDTIGGDSGNNVLDGAGGTDTVTFASAAGAVTANLATNSATGDGNDTINNFENLTGSNNNDNLTGDGNANTINGGTGNDTIDGAGGNDTLNGDAGNDVIRGGAGDDNIDGGGDTDTVDYRAAGAVTVNLGTNSATGDGNDTINNVENVIGSANADNITGDGGNNIIEGWVGGDTIDGGGGSDTISFANSGAGVGVHLFANIGFSGDAAGDGYTSIENIIGSGFNDVLAGDSNANVIDGGAGTDLIDYSNAAGAVNVNLTTGVVTGADGNDTLSNIEDVTGSTGNDTLIGTAGANVLNGGEGSDSIDGAGGIDTVSYDGVVNAVNVNLAGNTATHGAHTDTLNNLENVTGSANNDTIGGNSGNNTLDGGGGTDTVTYATAASGVTVNLSTNSATGDGTDTINNFENVTGSSNVDSITGDGNANVITGGDGADSLTGGLGADTFVIGNNAHMDAGETIDGTNEDATDDTLRIDASGTYDFTGVTVSNIDVVNLNSNNNNLVISDAMVQTADQDNDGTDGDLLLTYGANDVTSLNTANVNVARDVFLNGTGTVTLTDAVNNRVLSYVGVNTTINGGTGNDTIIGNTGVDTINGGAGNDVITGGAGADDLTGGLGADTFVYAAAAELAASESIDGTDENGTDDTIRLDATGAYNFTAVTVDNIDVVSLNHDAAGFNLTISDGMVDTADADNNGTDGDLLINAAIALTNDTTINAANVTTAGHAITVDGTNLGGADTITGGSNADTINGGAGDDIINGGAGNDALNGDDGDDHFDTSLGNDVYNGGNGSDTIDYSTYVGGTGVNVNLATDSGSGHGNDTLTSIENAIGTWRGDTITGDAGDNIISGFWGAQDWFDNLNGGDGIDTASYAQDATWVNANLSTTNATHSDGKSDLLLNFENLEGSHFNDTLTGDTGNNVFWGLGGDDNINGGAGVDTVSYAKDTAGVTVNLSTGTATDGAGDTDTLTSIEQVIGSDYNDNVTGDNNRNVLTSSLGDDTLNGLGGNDSLTDTLGSNTLNGGDGNDVLTTGNGDDIINGGADNDTIVAGWGDDNIDGGTGTDTLDYSAALSGVTVNLTTGSATDDNGDTDTISNIENIIGTSSVDTITGDASDNIITAGNGNDILSGAGGNDTFISGEGDDSYDGGSGTDTVDYRNDTTGLTINLTAGTATDSYGDTDTYTSIEGLIGTNYVDNFTGTASDDTLSGRTGNDVLTGGDGHDTLIGGHGADTLNGGDGNDTIYADNQAFSNATFSNLAYHIDASDIAGNGSAYTNGAEVNTWVDLSGTGNNMTGGGAGQTGTYNSSAMNGRAALSFDGGNDYMQAAVSLGTELTIFIVGADTSPIYFPAPDSVNGILSTAPSGAAQPGFAAYTHNTWDDPGNLNPSSGVDTDGTEQFYTINGGADSDRNGGNANNANTLAPINTDTIYQFDISGLTDSGVLELARFTDMSWYGDVEIAEVMIFNSILGDGDKADINSYLSNKYSIDLTGNSFGIDTLTGGLGADNFVWTESSQSGTSGGTRDTIVDFNSGQGDTITITDVARNLVFNYDDGFVGNGYASAYYSTPADTILHIDFSGDGVSNMEILLTGGPALTDDDVIAAVATHDGTDGIDNLTGTANADIMYGRDGNDTISGLADDDIILGQLGDDNLSGGDGADLLMGHDGIDTLDGGDGVDTLNGGAGADTFVYSDASHLNAGESIDGTDENATDDTLRLDDAGAYDFTTVTINNIDVVQLNEDAAGFNLTISDGMVDTADADNNGTDGDLLINAAIATSNNVTINAANVATAGHTITIDGTNLNGNDTLTGGAGADNLTGGLGADTFVLANAAHLAAGETIDGTDEDGTDDTVRIDATGTYDFSTVTISNIDVVNLNSANNNLVISDAMVQTADSDNDGADGDLLLTYGANDVSSLNTSSVNLARDVFLNGTGTVTLADGANNRVLSYVGVNTSVLGGSGNDTIIGNTGVDTIDAGAGTDIIYGGDGADDLTGGLGSDTFIIADNTHMDAGESIDGTDENLTDDTIRIDDAGAYNFTTVTVDNIDVIMVNDDSAGFNLTISDAMVSSADDNNDGTDGDLQIRSIGSMSNGVIIDASNVTTAGNTVRITGSNFDGNDTFTLGSNNDVVTGGDGDDAITGGDGADNLAGGAGADTFIIANAAHMDAGETIDGTNEDATDDTIRLDSAGAYNFTTVTVSNIDVVQLNVDAAFFNLTISDAMVDTADADNNGTDGDLLINSAVAMSNNVIINASNVTTAGHTVTIDGTNLNGNDDLTGGSNADTIGGGAGTDTLIGGAGADNLTGGTGADTFVISTAAHLAAGETIDGTNEDATDDTLRLDDADSYNFTTVTVNNIDVVSLNEDAAGFNLTISDAMVDSADADNDGTDGDLLINAAIATSNDVIINATNVTTAGHSVTVDGANLNGNDTLTGSSNADTIGGGSGNDTITGGVGADVLDGGAGVDTLNYSADTTGVSVSLAADTAAGGDATGDTISNFENVTGGSQNDTLTGDTGANTLTGNDGNDTLTGGYGGDTLVGGSGTDRIVADNVHMDLNSFGSLQLLLDANRGEKLTNGTDTGSWENLANSTVADATQNDATRMATLDTSAIGGRAAYNFDGTDVFHVEYSALLNSSSQTIFAVANTSNSAGAYQTIYSSRDAGAPYEGYILYHTPANNWAHWSGDGGAWDALTGSAAVDNQTEIFTTTFDGGNVEFFINGGSEDTTTGHAPHSDSDNDFHIGAGGDLGNALYLQGNVSEIIVFNATLTTSELASVNQYLSLKYSNELDGLSFGQDMLTGDAGADTFVWSNASHSAIGSEDTITDFSEAQGDKIELTFDNTLYITGNNTIGSGFTQQAGEIIFSGNDIQIDWGSDGAADFGITLTGVTTSTLETNDFIFHNVVGSDSGDFLNGSSLDDTLVGGYGGDTLTGGEGNDRIVADNVQMNLEDLGDLLLWLDPTDLDTISYNSSGNYVWQDKSGNGLDLTATGTGIGLTNINGRVVFDFDGTGDYFYDATDGEDGIFNNFVELSDGTTNITAFSIADYAGAYPASPSHNAIYGTTWGNTIYEGFGAVLTDSGGGVTFQNTLYPLTGSAFYGNNSSSASSYVDPLINAVRYDYTSNAGYLTRDVSVNATSEGINASLSSVTFNTLSHDFSFQVGSIRDGNYDWEGGIGEIIIFREALTDAEYMAVQEYLSLKYEKALDGYTFGTDNLTGGNGADTFVWSNASHSAIGSEDTITDFNEGQGDRIELTFDETLHITGATTFDTSFNSQAGEIIMNGNDIQIDFGGDGTADFGITLTGVATNTLETDDFLFHNVVGSDDTDILNGSYLDDNLHGAKGADNISGNDGDDAVIGGYGGDTLSGGSGNDRIVADNVHIDISSWANLALHLDANDVNANGSAVADGTAISNWQDKSSNAYTATAITTYDSAATLETNYFNGRSALDFGTTAKIYTLGSDYIYSDNDGLTVLSVQRSTTTGADSYLYDFGELAPDGYGFSLSSNNMAAYGPTNSGGTIASNTAYAGKTTSDFSVASVNWDFGGLLTANVDGQLVTSSSLAGLSEIDAAAIDENPTASAAAGPVTIGATSKTGGGSQATRDFEGQISEVLVFQRTLTSAELTAANEYFSMKYGFDLIGQDLGTDTLTGGTGADTFVWSNASHSAVGSEDTVTDYSEAQGDKIELTFDDTLYITSDSIGTSFTGQAGELIVTGNDIQLDWGGDSTADFAITLTGVTTSDLETDDFIFHNVVGSDGDDTLNGSTLDDSLNGSRGDDIINGNDGDDTLIGGYGGDTITGGAGNDTIYADNIAFDALSMTGIAAWFDASDINADGSIVNSGTVATWSNKVGATSTDASVGGNQAAVTTDAVNGRTALTFDGSDWYNLDGDEDLENLIKATGEITSFIVSANTSNTRGFTFSGHTSAGGNKFITGYEGSDELTHFSYNGSSGTNTPAVTTAEATNFQVHNAIWRDGVGAVNNLYLNEEGQGSYVLDNNFSDLELLSFGQEYDGGPTASDMFTGQMAEVILFNTSLTDAERELVGEYLSYKYDVALFGLSFGADTLTGGDGADTFVWTNASHSGTTDGNRDIITDFDDGFNGDTIDFSGVANNIIFLGEQVEDGLLGNGYNSASYYYDNGNTIVQIDVGGDGVSDFEIQLTGEKLLDVGVNVVTSFNAGTQGTSGNDTPVLTNNTDVYSGGGGNDIIDGLDGDDVLHGDDGADTIDGGRGDDVITGGKGSDTLIGGYGGDTIIAGRGNDAIYADSVAMTNSLISDMFLWLDATDESTFTKNASDEITAWADKSGVGNNATAFNTPVWDAQSTIGNRAAVTFNQANSEYFTIGNNTTFNFLHDGSGSTIFHVFKTDSGDPNDFYPILATYNTGSGNLGYQLSIDDRVSTTSNEEIISAASTGDGDIDTPASTLTHYMTGNDVVDLSAVQYLAVRDQYNIAGNDTELYVNGGLTTGSEYFGGNNPNTEDNAQSALHLGRAGTASFYYSGDISELIIFDRRLSDSEIATMNEYLSYKYGTNLSSESLSTDTLTGGLGADTFYWTNASHSGVGAGNRDIITDFSGSTGEGDIINLSSLVSDLLFVADTGLVGNGYASAAYTHTGDNTILQIDFGGDGTADMEIQVNGIHKLDNDDVTVSFDGTTQGTGGDDNVTLTSGVDVYQADAGNDTVDAGDGNDIVAGGQGDDTIYGGRGDDVLLGAKGNDTLVGGYGGDTLVGSSGDDRLVADNETIDLTDIAGLQLWLDGTDTSNDNSTNANGAEVTTWSNKAGTAVADGVSAATEYATYDNDALNGRGGLLFDGNNDAYTVAHATEIFDSSMTIFSVAHRVGNNTAGGNQTIYGSFIGSQVDDSDTGHYIYITDGGALQPGYGDGAAGAGWGFNAGTMNNGDTNILTYVLTPANATLYENHDSGFVNNEAYVPQTSNGRDFGIGAIYGGANYFDGVIGEIISFNVALSDANIALINEYLSLKYGDVLDGETFGRDVLSGGSGADTFAWTNASHSAVGLEDRITDFTQSENDKVELNFDQTLNISGDTGGSATWTNTAGELIWFDNGTNSFVQIDWGGDGVADFSIQLDGIADAGVLTSADFLFNTVTGTTGNDTLTGTDNDANGNGGDGTLSGGAGNDTLDGGTGVDVLLGGAGDDVLILDSNDLVIANALDGGADSDTLQFDGTGQSLDLTALDDTYISSIEKIDLDLGNNTIDLDEVDVGALNSGNDLYIDGNHGDTVNIHQNGGTAWTYNTTTVVNGTTYYHYSNNAINLYVDARIDSGDITLI